MESIKSQLEQTIKELYHLDFDVDLTPAPENIPADYSTNAPLRLARDLHKAPMAIAEELKGKFDNAEVSTPGFLNFTIASSELAKKINELDQDFSAHVSSGEYAGKTVICEFSDPNPFKVLHVGHLYTSIVGDSISRRLDSAGSRVFRA